MPVPNLNEDSKNYSKTTESLWNYYRDGADSCKADVNYSIRSPKSFDYEANITGRLADNNIEKEFEIVLPLKHFRKH